MDGVGRGGVGEPLGLGEDGRDDHAGLDDGHADPEGHDFLSERLAGRLQGVLHRRVVAMASDGDQPGDRAHVDDGAAPTLAHAGEHGLDHPDDPEVVRFEEALGPVDGHVPDGPAAPDARVVDEDVDASGSAAHRAHGAGHRGGVVHVEGDEADRELLGVDGRRQLGGGRRVAHTGVHVVAEPREMERGGEADAAAAAGDQGDGHDDTVPDS